MKRTQFKPKKGQVDFSKARFVPVINCVVRHKDKLLVVFRSKQLNFYPGYWNGISGFLDDQKTIEQKVKEELREEIGLTGGDIKKIRVAEIFSQEEPKYKKNWIVYPVLVDISTNKIKLDWEALAHRWVSLKEAKRLKLLPGVEEVLRRLSRWI